MQVQVDIKDCHYHVRHGTEIKVERRSPQFGGEYHVISLRSEKEGKLNIFLDYSQLLELETAITLSKERDEPADERPTDDAVLQKVSGGGE